MHTVNSKLNKQNSANQDKLVKAMASISKALKENNKSDFAKTKSTGGELLATGVQFIPGAGQILSPLVSLIDGHRDQMKEDIKNNYGAPVEQGAANIYGNTFKFGGTINPGFKQYNTGGHVTGDDQGVNAYGTPSGNEVAKIQNKENSFMIDGKPFVMSDVLVNPRSGNTFNMDAAKINRKYKGASMMEDEKNGLDFEMKQLAKTNQMMINTKEVIEKMYGGPITPPKTNSIYDLGLTIDNNVDPIDSVPPSNNLWLTPNNPASIPIQSNLQPLPTISLPKNINGITTVEHPNLVNDGIPLEQKQRELKDRFAKRMKREEQDAQPRSDFNYNTIAVGLKGLALARSAYDASRPAEKETLISPDYTRADRQMYKQNYDYSQAKQSALGAANMMSNVNRSAASNFAQYQNRQGQNFANLGDNLSNIEMQQSNQNIGLNMSRSQYEANKSVDFTNRRYQNRIDNQQNKANSDFAKSKFFSELSQVGTSFNEYQYHRDMVQNNKEIATAKINEGLAIIGSKYSNFGFDDNFINNIKNGKASIDDKIKFISTTQKIKQDGN